MSDLVENYVRFSRDGLEIDLAIKYARVNLWSSLEQTMMGPMPKCYIPKVFGFEDDS